MKGACFKCLWWRHNAGQLGDCRRHSPSIDSQTGRGVWPVTSEDDGCGEFQLAQIGKDRARPRPTARA